MIAPSERTLALIVFTLCVGFNLVCSHVGLHNSLFEIHESRQFQTAFTTRYLQEEGFHLAYPTPLFGPPWSAPMEFPLYQLCVGKLSSVTGIPLEPAGRLVSIGFLYGALPAFFGLLGVLGLQRPRRWLALSLLLVSPAYLYYSRTFLIESTALCAAAWFLFSFCRAVEQRTPKWVALAAVLGVAAALIKITTFVVFLSVTAIFTVAVLWRHRNALDRRVREWSRTSFVALLAIIPAVVAAILWVRFSDHVKASNPLSFDLVSTQLSWFNFGTWAQRASLDFWNRIQMYTTMTMAPFVNIVLGLVFAILLGRTYRRRALVLLGGFLAGPLIFANLYFVHDYYFYASGVFLIGIIGLGWCQLLDLENTSAWGRWGVIALSLGVQVFSYWNGYLRAQRFNATEPPALAAVLSATTAPQDVVVIYGHDWDARVPYYAHRRAIMVRDHQVLNTKAILEVVDRVEQGRVTALAVAGDLRNKPEFLKPVIERLHLSATPVLASEDTHVYLPEKNLTAVLAALDFSKLTDFKPAESARDTSSSIPRRRSAGSSLDPRIVEMLEPTPRLIVHPFSLGEAIQNDRRVLNAHAPTDAIFTIPENAQSVRAEFGMDKKCYLKENHTDGVEFRVELVTPDGAHRTLFSSFLSPTDRASDRGEKILQLTLSREDRGQLWFRTLAGPTGSISCAWSYWAKVEIK